jgi:hypothetical protein
VLKPLGQLLDSSGVFNGNVRRRRFVVVDINEGAHHALASSRSANAIGQQRTNVRSGEMIYPSTHQSRVDNARTSAPGVLRRRRGGKCSRIGHLFGDGNKAVKFRHRPVLVVIPIHIF